MNKERPAGESRELADGVRLRRCPFCSSSDLGLYEYTYAKMFAVDCQDCGAQGPRRPSPETAIALWNQRAGE